MKNEPHFETFRQAFSRRIELTSAIKDAMSPLPTATARLKESTQRFDEAISLTSNGEVEDQYRAYGLAAGIFILLADWKRAIRTAEPDAARFLGAARMAAVEFDRTTSTGQVPRLNAFLEAIAKVQNLDDLDDIQRQLLEWPLPLLLFANLPSQGPSRYEFEDRDPSTMPIEREDTTVAFLRFDIDGQPAQSWNYLKPRTSYDLTIEVRVSNWPEEAEFLSLVPITIDRREREWLPKFSFKRPEGVGPFTLTGTGRAVLEIAHSLGSRPYEFLYAAEFDQMTARRPIEIVGHRRLVLEGTDIASNPLTGFRNVDRHLLTIRNRLRSTPGLDQDELADAMTIMGGFGSIAAHALRDAAFPARLSEKEFQVQATRLLRMRPDIGDELRSHPETAGGITDLTFRDIPIELKVEHSQALLPKDFSRYFDQTAAYAVGQGKRLGILSVLEASEKSGPVGDVEKDIEFFRHPIGTSAVFIIVVVVRGGMPKPSSFSTVRRAGQ